MFIIVYLFQIIKQEKKYTCVSPPPPPPSKPLGVLSKIEGTVGFPGNSPKGTFDKDLFSGRVKGGGGGASFCSGAIISKQRVQLGRRGPIPGHTRSWPS